MAITRRAALLMAGCALAAVVLPGPLAWGMLIAVVVFTAADALNVRSVPELVRAAPPLLSRGVPGRLSINPSGRWPRIDVKQPAEDADTSIVPDTGRGRLDATITISRRGSHPLPPAATRAVGPLGLGAWYHRSGPKEQVTVYPDLPAARRLALDVRTGRFRDEGRRSRGPLGLGTDLESVREYQPDDDIRQVNWRATARVGTPMSNTYRVHQDRDVLVVIDCGRLMAAPTTDSAGRPITRLDAAVDVAAAMTAVAVEVGDHIGVIAFAGDVLRSVAPRRDNEAAVLHAIHDLEPILADADYERAFQLTASRKGAFVLVLTDLMDEVAARPLVDAIPVLGRRHSVTIASTEDEDLADALRTGQSDRHALARKAIAADLHSAQRLAAGRLRHFGADVVTAPAPSLSARCVASYLRAKRNVRF